MTTIQQLMQTGQVKANEILAKLVDTPATAAKTRERLVSELKAEFDRQAEFEEQRLFPVLRKHEATKDLVAKALNDSRQMRKLFSELERSPKDSEAFGTKVAEFRDLFQRRFRDDTNEIMPAVVKALNDEEASTAVGKTGNEMTGITSARRADGGEHPMTEAARQSAEIVKAGMDAVQQGAQVARRAMGASTDAAGGRDWALQSTTALEEMQETAREAASVGSSMMELLNEQARHAVQATMAVGRARTLAEVVRVQSDFIGGSVQRMEQFNERYLALIRGWRGFAALPSVARR